ncbi:MAG: hypothetical protein ACE5KE_01490 [Methanosarcinales archaeon]
MRKKFKIFISFIVIILIIIAFWFSLGNYLFCEFNRNNIPNEIKNANYCDTKDDCRFLSTPNLGQGCYDVNKNEYEDLNEKIHQWVMSCYKIIQLPDIDCFPHPNSTFRCINNKCVRVIV